MLPLIAVTSLAAVALLAIGPHRRMPLSERVVLSLLHLAAWIERTATALDAAIVRYRMERQTLCVRLESTRMREGA